MRLSVTRVYILGTYTPSTAKSTPYLFYLPRATGAGFERTPKSGRPGEKNDPRSVPALFLVILCGTSTRRVPVDQ